MTNGVQRFNFYLDQLVQLFLEAAKQPDAALWLYQNGARTPLFMLEGLAKLYSGILKKKRFDKMEKRFKRLEDRLGAIDYYDAFAKDFATDPNLPVETAQFARAKCDEQIASLNELLKDKKWIGEKATRLAKTKKKLDKTEWLDDEDEVKAIEHYYQRSIKKINAFAKRYENGFTDLESQVHELRRKLRWLSIYPQALQGAVQLNEAPTNDPNVAKYLAPEIINSPFNKMPAAGENRVVLKLNRDYFLALSWMIAELGKLKDEGLRMALLDEAKAEPDTEPANETDILQRAFDITRAFFAEKNLDKMMAGVSEPTEAAKPASP